MDSQIKKENRDFIDLVDQDFEISRGSPLPLGASLLRGGINFALFSKNATSVTLVLFIPGVDESIAEFPFDNRYNRTGDIWHAFVRGLDFDIEYGYRVEREQNDSGRIHRFGFSRILLDPYARAISGGESWGEVNIRDDIDSALGRRRSLIVEDDFDWGLDQPLNIPLSDSIIYELHLRGFTRHESSNVINPGTYAGLVEKIPYLKELGITAVELLPINEFSETDTNRINPITGETLLNFWGYHTIGFFAPKASYASDSKNGGQVREFKSMVKAFHQADIEVILDVVFNHTAEGDERGPTLSFRGLDNSVYYLIDPSSGEYYNYSGCGNSLNCNHPVVRNMILECLRYWVMEMHVDGFRFDLASILGRGRDGSVLANPPLLERIAEDPILGHTKLIAEAWDAAGLYQVGSFPAWGRWAEWNGKFRDDIRKFVKSDSGMVSILADRFMGSPDIYSASGRAPYHSINFITCHDGFPLADLVAYDKKHNEMNGEDSRDGESNNNSWNCGWEGPVNNWDYRKHTNTDPERIKRLRRRQIKNFSAILLLSRGVPMILAGDELGRTQNGNNNAYCQDNEISWVDWNLVLRNSELFRFFKQLIEFRKTYKVFRNDDFNESEFPIVWHGLEPGKPDWSTESRCLAMQIKGKADSADKNNIDIYIVTSAFWEPLPFKIPELSGNRKWFRKIDTYLESPNDISETNEEPVLNHQREYMVGPRSVVVFLGK